MFAVRTCIEIWVDGIVKVDPQHVKEATMQQLRIYNLQYHGIYHLFQKSTSACLLVNLQFIPYLFHPISMLEREFAPTIGRDSINNKSVFRQQTEIPQEKAWDI